jgi:hypothetical protein
MRYLIALDRAVAVLIKLGKGAIDRRLKFLARQPAVTVRVETAYPVMVAMMRRRSISRRRRSGRQRLLCKCGCRE